MKFQLKDGMLLGVSTSATQIEGGNVNSNWNDWYEQGRILDGTDPATGNDHWEKWEEDVALMAQMGITVEDVHRELASRHIIDHKVKQEKMTK